MLQWRHFTQMSKEKSQQNQRRKQSKKDKVVKIEINRNHFIIVAAVSRLSQFGAYFQGHQ